MNYSNFKKIKAPTEFIVLEEQLMSLNTKQVLSYGHNVKELEKGIQGEEKIYKLLSKYTNQIFPNIVVWNKKRFKVTEADFAAMINGYLIVCEVKEWYGKIYRAEQKEEVVVRMINHNGNYVSYRRTSPIYSLGAFSSDLLLYLKPSVPKKDVQFLRYLVFSRDDVDFDESFFNYDSKITVCKYEEFNNILNIISQKKNDNPYTLQKELPSWDYFYNKDDKKWYKIAILSKQINTSDGLIEVSDIDSILFVDESGLSVIKLTNGTFIESVIDRESVSVSSYLKFAKNNIFKFIKFNIALHSF